MKKQKMKNQFVLGCRFVYRSPLNRHPSGMDFTAIGNSVNTSSTLGKEQPSPHRYKKTKNKKPRKTPKLTTKKTRKHKPRNPQNKAQQKSLSLCHCIKNTSALCLLLIQRTQKGRAEIRMMQKSVTKISREREWPLVTTSR